MLNYRSAVGGRQKEIVAAGLGGWRGICGDKFENLSAFTKNVKYGKFYGRAIL
jgi:hypothetical protein